MPKTIAVALSDGDTIRVREFTILQGRGEWPPARTAWAQCMKAEKETGACSRLAYTVAATDEILTYLTTRKSCEGR